MNKDIPKSWRRKVDMVLEDQKNSWWVHTNGTIWKIINIDNSKGIIELEYIPSEEHIKIMKEYDK